MINDLNISREFSMKDSSSSFWRSPQNTPRKFKHKFIIKSPKDSERDIDKAHYITSMGRDSRTIEIKSRNGSIKSKRIHQEIQKEDKSISMTPSSYPIKVDESIQNTTISNFMDKEEFGLCSIELKKNSLANCLSIGVSYQSPRVIIERSKNVLKGRSNKFRPVESIGNIQKLHEFLQRKKSMEMPKKVRPIFKYKFDIQKVNDQVKKIKENYIRRNQARISPRETSLVEDQDVRNCSYHLRKPNLFSKIVLPPQKANANLGQLRVTPKHSFRYANSQTLHKRNYTRHLFQTQFTRGHNRSLNFSEKDQSIQTSLRDLNESQLYGTVRVTNPKLSQRMHSQFKNAQYSGRSSVATCKLI
ncbi:unnamed protein product [Moneuplotes crassus]|uniref:Uncharacterized protein n=1 Tax=Euplotes crassus TaxID=5936 RepID=A0AAD1XE47_EUPCR|nr:unnamed protein product [Moneuplotes crassus]